MDSVSSKNLQVHYLFYWLLKLKIVTAILWLYSKKLSNVLQEKNLINLILIDLQNYFHDHLKSQTVILWWFILFNSLYTAQKVRNYYNTHKFRRRMFNIIKQIFREKNSYMLVKAVIVDTFFLKVFIWKKNTTNLKQI